MFQIAQAMCTIIIILLSNSINYKKLMGYPPTFEIILDKLALVNNEC